MRKGRSARGYRNGKEQNINSEELQKASVSGDTLGVRIVTLKAEKVTLKGAPNTIQNSLTCTSLEVRFRLPSKGQEIWVEKW
jgi:hypothetical protein